MRRALCVLAVLVAACGPIEPSSTPAGSRRDPILAGSLAFGEPQVFAMYMRYPSGGALCSSTLIGRRTLLTAAHCVEPENGRAPEIEVTNDVSIDVAPASAWIPAVSSASHPFYRPNIIGKYDIAVVTLAKEPPVPVKPWNTEAITTLKYVPMRVVGYGITNDELEDSGLKRVGQTRLTEVRGDQIDFGKEGAGKSGTCSGDSGGPSYYTFPDGTERVVGVHSFHTGACGNNTDARVDRFAAQIAEWLQASEGGSCDADLRCQTVGCATPDPDCGCLEDGTCTSTCTGPLSDPDCASACAADGVCSNQPCAMPDPDCQPLGALCGHGGHCGSRLCITSPQHEVRPYCSQACVAASGCPAGFDCVSGQCRHRVLPAAAEGEPCAVGATWCGDPALRCASWARESVARCRRTCFGAEGCIGSASCVPSSEEPEIGVCVPNVLVPKLRTEALSPGLGCSTTPGAAALWLLALGLVTRRRRCGASRGAATASLTDWDERH